MTISIFWDLEVTSIENHQKIHLFKIIKIWNKLKIFKYHRIGNFFNIIDLRKLDFLSEDKISERSRFVTGYLNIGPVFKWWSEYLSVNQMVIQILNYHGAGHMISEPFKEGTNLHDLNTLQVFYSDPNVLQMSGKWIPTLQKKLNFKNEMSG